jgi:orotate phosphoribosyltransferase
VPEQRSEPPAHATGTVQFVALDDIAADDHFRLRAEGDVSALAASIGRLGQLDPVELRPLAAGAGGGPRWQLVAGFRRVAALRMLLRERALARLHQRLADEDAWAVALTQALAGEPLGEAALEALRARIEPTGVAPWALGSSTTRDAEAASTDDGVEELSPRVRPRPLVAVGGGELGPRHRARRLERAAAARAPRPAGAGAMGGRVPPLAGGGRAMTLADDRTRLLALLRALSFERRRVVLASGRESDFYIDCKRTTLTAEGHVLVGRLLLDRVRRLEPPVRGVGGLTLGADPLASAIAAASFLERERAQAGGEARPPPAFDAFIVRKEPKGHGTGQWIEGRRTIPDGSRVAVLEDVVTTGGSALKAIERCRAEGLAPVACLALVDRMEGGREAIEAQGVPLQSLYTREDFPA